MHTKILVPYFLHIFSNSISECVLQRARCSPPLALASEFTKQQLKQFRAQCIVFLAFRNEEEPKKLHLEIALGGCPAQGGGGGGGVAVGPAAMTAELAAARPRLLLKCHPLKGCHCRILCPSPRFGCHGKRRSQEITMKRTVKKMT